VRDGRKRKRRVLGYSAIAVGTASTIVFLSPIFPIGIEGLVIGAIFFGIAWWALGNASFSRLLHPVGRPPAEATVPIDPLLPVQILRLAREAGGTLTVAQVAMELNIPISEAQTGLLACVRSGSASEDYNVEAGYAVFTFPEFRRPEPGSEGS